MSLGDDLTITSVQCDLKGANTEQILKNLSWKISKDINMSASAIFADIRRSEKRGDAGIGDGVAVLDWRNEALQTPYVLVSRLETPLDMKTADERPVDLVLVLISPESQSLTHLRHVARLTRMFREEGLLEHLRSVKNNDGMMAVLSSENQRFLAA